MQFGGAAPLDLEPDDCDLRRVVPRVFVEAGDGEEEILERVERVVLGRRARKVLVGGGGKEGACLGETEVGLALGRGGDLFGLPTVPGTLNVVWYGES